MSQIYCPRLSAGFTWNFETELRRLESGNGVALQQPASQPPAEPFRGGRVAAVHDGVYFYAVAEFEDVDIFNEATRMNQRTWMLGDVFEIFLRPSSQESYYEFHVTPENQIMQLRIPNSDAFYRKGPPEEKRATFQQNLLAEKFIESSTEVQREKNLWRAMVSIPLDRISENKKWEATDAWMVSFCRYDYTRGQLKPVVSSSSSHQRMDFHNQSEWRRLVFNSGDSLS
jgi:hypothetical protein